MSARISEDWAIGSAGPRTLTFGVAHSFPGEDVMLDIPLLSSIARQMMSSDIIEIEGKRLPVRRTSRQRLRTVTFDMDGRSWKAAGSEGQNFNWIGKPFEETVPGG